jgi:polyphenol oxidase
MFKLHDAGYYFSTLIDDDHFRSGFSTRKLGDGARRDVVSSFASSVLGVDSIVTLKQIHSGNAVFINGDHPYAHTPVPDADGIVTDHTGQALFLKTADCLPAVFVDKTKGLSGVGHLGYKGVLNGLAEHMIERFTDHGSDPKHIHVAIGPTIGSCCYDITDERAEQFRQAYGKHMESIMKTKNGKTFLDLSDLVTRILIDHGVQEKNIDRFDKCTKCNRDEFYSYRAEGKELSGELFSFVTRR